MVNVSTIELYATCKYDIYRNMSNFASLTAQNNYYNSLSKKTVSARFNKIGDPFLISGDIEDLIGYSYGRILMNGFYWYFQISDMNVNAQGQTVISYTIDAWESLRYQKNLKLGAGEISRYSRASNVRLLRSPITPSTYKVEDVTMRNYKSGGDSWSKPCVLGIVRNNDSDWCTLVCQNTLMNSSNYVLINPSAIAKYISDAILGSGKLITNGQIMGLWYSSFTPLLTNDAWHNSGTNDVWYFQVTDSNRSMDALKGRIGMCPSVYGTMAKARNSPTEEYYISDERGNMIYRFPDNADVGATTYIDMVLNMSMTSCQWIGTMPVQPDDSSTICYDYFEIPCEPLDYYTDAWTTYQATQRQIDIDSRNLQMNSNLTGSLAGIGTSAVSGAVLGSVVPGIGTAVGALAGGIMGAVSSLTGYASSAYNSPKQQEILDRSYKSARDDISMNGNGVNGALMMALEYGYGTPSPWNVCGAGIKRRVYDELTASAIEDEQDVYGYYVDIMTDNVDSYIRDGAFQCSCEVLNCPSSFGAQVQNRLANGVYFS